MNIRFLVLCGGLCAGVFSATGQFVAFNDYDSGERQAHPFTTRYSLSYWSQTNDVQGPLRDIEDGSFLPAQVRISGGLGYPRPTTNFFSGTPATLVFGGSDSAPEIVNFRDSGLTLNGTNTHTFSRLNPARKYQFIGTANFAAPSNSPHRTLYAIEGADSYGSAHTSNCLTTAQLSIITSNQVVLLAGRNSYPGYGDIIVWNDIRVGADGAFSVTATPFLYDIGMSFGGFRLVEDFVDPTPPFITKQPASLSASRASTQSLAPKISGSLPLSFQWFKDSLPLASGTNRTLRFNSLQPEDAGTYWLVTTNPFGTIMTTNVTVTVSNDAIGIVGQPQNRSLRYGDLLSLSVTVTGTPPYFFQWFQNGSPIQDWTNSGVVIAAADVQHSGSYWVRISNLFSSALSSTGVVSVVHTPLRIFDQPQSQTVTQGNTLRVEVAVAGSAPRFQWLRNGVSIPNATNSVYRVASATTNHAGNYFVVATGPMNSVTSAVASVTIVPPVPPAPFSGFHLFALTNVWAYDQSGDDLGTTWREGNFDDSSWLTGRGVLAIETSLPTIIWTNTVLRLTTDAGQPIITSYFRTHFFWPTSAIGASLLFSNLIDDGAIFYLNGVPLFRYNMPGGIVASSTLAPAANPGGEGVFVVTNLAAPMIVEGDNVLAVEVHQNSPTSSDIVFGTAVWGYNIPDVPLSIVASPTNQTVFEGQPLELGFVLNGSARFQWYHDGLPVYTPNGPTLSVRSAVPSDGGEYFVIATNSLGAVTSAVAVVQVVADVQPPRVLRAVLQTNRTSILVEFDERLLSATATNIDHYRALTSDGSEAAALMSAAYSNRVVTLTLAAPPPENTNLILQVDGIADVSTASNHIASLLVSIRQFLLLVPLEGVWKYDDRGLDLGMAWRAAFYDDSLWPSGPAMLYNDFNYGGGDDIPPPPFPLVLATNTWIQMTNEGVPVVTHYFRRPIHFAAASLLGAQLSLQTMIDDGAVMYLNGSEFFRLGVTNDPVYATNLASRPRGTSVEAFMEGPFLADFPAGFSLATSNVLAVETHQINPVDVSFGAEISLLLKSFTNESVRILRQPVDLSVGEGEPFAFEVDSIGGAHGQWLRDGMPIDGAQGESLSGWRARMSDDGSLFAFSLSNAFGSLLSSNATLRVRPDTNAPRLLSAWSGESLTEIRLTFSEPIMPTSVTNVAQFQVLDDQGRGVVITGVSMIDDRTLVLTTEPRAPARNYVVRVEGVRDLAAVPNEVEAGTGAMVGYEQPLVPLTALWRYDQSGNGQVDGWKAVEFDDSTWLAGPALLYNDTFTTAVPLVPLGTLLAQTNAMGLPITTHYFRHAFDFPELASGAVLLVRQAFDDALVLYLNGTEIFRTNVPVGVVDATTTATSTIGDASLSAPLTVPWNGSFGPSVLTAETHQTLTSAGSDVAFAVELSITRPSTALPPGGPMLRIARAGAQLRLSWAGSNYVLESATALDGEWSAVEGVVSPLLVQASGSNRFYRLRKP
jgi:hypothetical protein